jgi:acyl-CoA synthetase (AMP-forming)/AMP-acid ligase II
MTASAEWNFAARLTERARGRSLLIDAPTGQRLDPEGLVRAVSGFAAAFRAAGLRAGDRVLVGCDLSPSSSLAYLGIMYAGLVAVPMNERDLASSGAAIAGKVAARGAWTPHATPLDWTAGAAVRQFAGRLDIDLAAGAAGGHAQPRGADDLAALMPTSGSTGAPRLVKVSHGNLLANTEAIVRSQRLGPDERAMLILPVSYCFGASVLHTHLYQGGGVVFDSRFMFPDKVLRAISEFGCTTFAGVPTAYNILLRRSSIRSIPLHCLRRFLQAGGPLATERVAEVRAIVPHADFFVMYGQTEATARISCLPPGRLADKPGSVGAPLDNVSVRIVGDNGETVPPGEKGEIWASGASICGGYLDDPDATAQKFQGGWLATGDVGFADHEGFLWIVGRKGEFIKMRGVRVGFAEVEAIVAATPGVRDCAAVAVPHVEAGEALAVYVVADSSTADLATAVRRRLPPEWICDSVNFIAELPKTAHGKIARALLRPHDGAASR